MGAPFPCSSKEHHGRGLRTTPTAEPRAAGAHRSCNEWFYVPSDEQLMWGRLIPRLLTTVHDGDLFVSALVVYDSTTHRRHHGPLGLHDGKHGGDIPATGGASGSFMMFAARCLHGAGDPRDCRYPSWNGTNPPADIGPQTASMAAALLQCGGASPPSGRNNQGPLNAVYGGTIVPSLSSDPLAGSLLVICYVVQDERSGTLNADSLGNMWEFGGGGILAVVNGGIPSVTTGPLPPSPTLRQHWAATSRTSTARRG